jgi:hypothetical protein
MHRERIHRSSWVGLTFALAVIVVACHGPTTPHWADKGIHVVDDHWIADERPCDLASSDACVAAVRAAEASLGIDPRTVVGAATAGLPTRWVRSDGQEIYVMPSYGGGPPEFVLLDLADDSRRTSGYGCWGVPDEDGTMNCGPVPLDQYRVGATPFD